MFHSRGWDKAAWGAQHRPGKGLGDHPTLTWEMMVISPLHRVCYNHLHGVRDAGRGCNNHLHEVGYAGRGWNDHLHGVGNVGGLCLLA